MQRLYSVRYEYHLTDNDLEYCNVSYFTTYISIKDFTSQEHEFEVVRQELWALFLRLQQVLFRVGSKILNFRFKLGLFLCNELGGLVGMDLPINVGHLAFGSCARHEPTQVVK